MTGTLKRLLLDARSAASLLAAIFAYLVSGTTPSGGLQAMIRMHALTNGWTTRALAAFFSAGRPARSLDDVRDPADLFAGMGGDGIAAVVRGLQEDGYAIAPTRIPSEVTARLRAFAEETPGIPTSATGKSGTKRPYDRSDRTVAKFQFDAGDLASQVDIQNLAADAGLLEIAQRYLGCLPVLDSIAMWWSTPHLDRPADEIAQTFHFDCDRLKWIKIFIYLTDVTEESGPHVFVRHSHLREPRRAGLLSRGYVRLQDEDVRRVYRGDEFVDIVGPAGTVLFEDTSGFHKGRMPEKRERLMLEYQFSCNLFGANYPRMPLSRPAGERLAAARRALPSSYPMFV
jgi:hypothetical protein